MKILITGGTGLVGTHLVPRLLMNNHKIRLLVRKTSRLNSIKDLQLDLHYGDINDQESLNRAVEGVEAVIHLVHLPPLSVGEAANRENYFRINADGTRHLLEACRHVALKNFIHVSSLSVITGFRDHYGTKEDAPYVITGDNYADSKIKGEQLALEYYQRYGIPVTVLRPGFIYGPGDNLILPPVIRLLKTRKAILIDHGKKRITLTYVDNFVDAIELALEKDGVVGEVFNIGDDEHVTRKKFFDTVAELMDLPRPSMSVPFSVARVFCWLFSTTYKTLHIKSDPPVSWTKLRFGGLSLFFDFSKAKSLLDYQPKIQFEEGMRRAIIWYLADHAA